jgi:hypothetical protein
MHLQPYTLFIDHTYTFWLPFATILNVYIIKEYNKKLCVVNLSNIQIYKMLFVDHTFMLCHLVLLNTVHPDDGRRGRLKHVGVVNNIYSYKCICWFLHKTCLNAQYGTHTIRLILFSAM